MLLSFRVANHGSLREPQELNFVPSYEDERPAVPVVAVYGANASGKSTLVDAFRFFRTAVKESQARWLPGAPVPRRPFLLDRTSRAEPSTYAVDLLVGDVRYVYGFGTTDHEITEEWLYSYPKARRRVLFERSGATMTFGPKLGGGRVAAEHILRPNSLYLSAAAQTSHPELGRVWKELTALHIVGDETRQALASSSVGAFLTSLYEAFADLGLPIGSEVLAAADLGVQEIRPGQERPEVVFPGGFLDLPRESKMRVAASRTLEFVHVVAGEEFVLPAEAESAGTKTWLNLVTRGLSSVLIGRAMWVDELDISLHPLLTAKLVSLFQDPELNPLGAQLIFTTHDASLLGTMLGEQVLRRDQVWFVEKAPATGASELYPLSDFKPRKGENFERRYLAGSYGAVPLLPETAFEDLLRKHWGTRDAEEVPA
ncbi:ATP/GTP-binding protein [Streptomyces sp. NPDC051567]|uniref:ATP/GTP-binding protein n=1 Tax=Streptomyces sp. NPDC051567 TaxID=3365660 RepID=UPI003794FB41